MLTIKQITVKSIFNKDINKITKIQLTEYLINRYSFSYDKAFDKANDTLNNIEKHLKESIKNTKLNLKEQLINLNNSESTNLGGNILRDMIMYNNSNELETDTVLLSKMHLFDNCKKGFNEIKKDNIYYYSCVGEFDTKLQNKIDIFNDNKHTAFTTNRYDYIIFDLSQKDFMVDALHTPMQLLDFSICLSRVSYMGLQELVHSMKKQSFEKNIVNFFDTAEKMTKCTSEKSKLLNFVKYVYTDLYNGSDRKFIEEPYFQYIKEELNDYDTLNSKEKKNKMTKLLNCNVFYGAMKKIITNFISKNNVLTQEQTNDIFNKPTSTLKKSKKYSCKSPINPQITIKKAVSSEEAKKRIERRRRNKLGLNYVPENAYLIRK